MPFRRQKTSWFVTLPIAAVAVGFLVVIFFPTARAIKEKKNDLAQKEDYIAETEALRTVMAQTERDLKDAQDYSRQWRSQATAPAHASKLFGKILNEARQSGINTSRFEPQTEVALETVHHTPVHMELSGSYAEVCQLLASLEKLPETVWVEHLKLEKTRESGQHVKCDVKLEVFTGESNNSG